MQWIVLMIAKMKFGVRLDSIEYTEIHLNIEIFNGDGSTVKGAERWKIDSLGVRPLH